MFETELRVVTPDGEMKTFVTHPDGEGPFPVAVLFMDGSATANRSRRTPAASQPTATTSSRPTSSTEPATT